MKKSISSYNMRRASLCLSVLLLALPLASCHLLTLAPSDPQDQCDHPAKPAQPVTDGKAAQYVLEQGAAIDRCRALLGEL